MLMKISRLPAFQPAMDRANSALTSAPKSRWGKDGSSGCLGAVEHAENRINQACRDNNIPIVVFNIRQPGNLAQVLDGKGMATVVQNEE